MNNIISESLSKSITYDAYIEMVRKLVDAHDTTGSDKSEIKIDYTKLNYRRMLRLNKTLKLSEKLVGTVSALPFKMKWLVISEAWCGDAAQNIPFIAQLAKACPNVELVVVLRDENLSLMDEYLTNGSRSIPKVVFLRADTLEEISTWGPRPEIVQQQVLAYKKEAATDMPYEKFAEQMHVWYTKNKNIALESELLAIFQSVKESILL